MFEDLAANPSRNFKLDYLKQNADNETLREVVRLALDPFTQFYQRKIPNYTPNTDTAASLAAILPGLFDLSHRLVTGHDAIHHLQMMLEAVSPDDAKVLERIIQKDLKCGVQVSTANDVWSGLIKEYPVMLCSPYEQKLIDKINYPAYVQLKEDGMRFNAIVELLVKIDGKIADRQTGNGILNKANKGTISKEEAALVCATVWDYIPYVLFTDGYSPTPYQTRFERLELAVEGASKRIELVPSIIVDSLDEAKAIFEQYLIDGKEGIILKDSHGVWEDKRSKGQIKFKGELECDLKIVGVEEGTGKYAGKVGSFLCESSDGVVKVSVGSGLSDQQRDSFSNLDLLGRIVAVKYNARITNKQGEQSLFLPIFIELREDKDVADSSKDIK